MQHVIIQSVLDDRIYIAQGVDALPDCRSFVPFSPDPAIKYHAFCDDFGPMNLACIADFTQQLDDALAEHPTSRLFYFVDEGKRQLTNAVFLLGSYMLLRLDMPVDEVVDALSWADDGVAEEYRDATFSAATFRLSLADCWRGLAKGIRAGWLRLPDPIDDHIWGQIDMEQYRHFDNPLNGDAHEVVPGKLVAFQGPRDLGGREYHDDACGCRSFSASFYAEALKELGVGTVVRLNEAEYDAGELAAHGIDVLDLPFDDCTSPPPRVALAFLAAVERAHGVVAVHCKAGLGRTGTLIALHLMRSHGFAAREAMGWLRIMRPGSVIGEQQHYLCAVEQAAAVAAAAEGCSAASLTSAEFSAAVIGCWAATAGAAEDLAEQVAEGMERRGAARAQLLVRDRGAACA